MIIHSYLTDGFFEFGKIFIESFKKFHGESMPIILTTRNLNLIQRKELESIYSNIMILNRGINIGKLSKKTGIEIEKLRRYKYEIENECISHRTGNVIWKQFISVEDRYRNSIKEAMLHANGEKYMMHIDADSFIRKELDSIFKVIEENEVSLVFRNSKKLNRKIFGCLSGYKLCENTEMFLNKWIEKIDVIPLIRKPAGYGQESCYLAYTDLKNSGVKWGHIKPRYIRSKIVDDTIIWTGNHSRGKIKTLNLFRNELELL